MTHPRKALTLVALLAAGAVAVLANGSPAPVQAADPASAQAAKSANFGKVIAGIPGLTHYYPLDATNQARDVVGGLHGTNHGATFGAKGAKFDGRSYIELPDSNDFSPSTTGAFTVVAFNTIDNWRGAGASEYVHWMGKGTAGAHEWTFRHYVQGGTGEASSRPYRTSFYQFNKSGGLGAGSYFQDPDAAGVERVVAGAVDRTSTYMFKNGQLRDQDALSGYSIRPANTSSPVRLGTRDKETGFLVGKLRRVAFFNRKLSESELNKIFAARNLPEGGASAPSPQPTPTATPTVTPSTPTGGPVRTPGRVYVGSKFYPVAGHNMRRRDDDLVIYTHRGGTTGTNEYGAEVIVVRGVVKAVRNSVGSARVPMHGVVLSGHGDARAWLLANAKVGMRVVRPPR